MERRPHCIKKPRQCENKGKKNLEKKNTGNGEKTWHS